MHIQRLFDYPAAMLNNTRMEKLKTYLKGQKKQDFAKAIGVSPSFLSQMLSGHRPAPDRVAQAIETETRGKVRASHLKGKKHDTSKQNPHGH
jgi:DNA-binding transcriptional regulator YdaS (Cro superfamily)